MINQRQQPKKAVEKAEEQAAEPAPEVSKEAADPLDEVLRRAEIAYGAYLEAQRKVATAY